MLKNYTLARSTLLEMETNAHLPDDSMYFTGIVYICSLCLQRKPNESIYCAKRFAPQRISVSILLPVGIPSCLKETNL